MKKEKSKGRKWIKFILIFILVFAVLGILLDDDDSKTDTNETEVVEDVDEEEPEEEEEVDENGWTKDDKINFKTITEIISDEYLSDYKSPWSLDDWVFAKFDDEGRIIVTTDYTVKDTSIKQPVMCVFTYVTEDEAYKGHFLSVGDMVFLDDGTCDEFFQNLQDIMNSTNE